MTPFENTKFSITFDSVVVEPGCKGYGSNPNKILHCLDVKIHKNSIPFLKRMMEKVLNQSNIIIGAKCQIFLEPGPLTPSPWGGLEFPRLPCSFLVSLPHRTINRVPQQQQKSRLRPCLIGT